MQTSIEINELATALAHYLTSPIFKGRVWAQVPMASRYMVSDAGEIVSFVGKVPRKLSPIRAGEYTAVQLAHDNGHTFKRYVHRLVLEAFCGHPEPGDEARHLNGDRTNNSVENLRWGTHKENEKDKESHGTNMKGGEGNPMARLTYANVVHMRRLRGTEGATFKAIGEQFGVSTMTAYRAVTKRTWK